MRRERARGTAQLRLHTGSLGDDLFGSMEISAHVPTSTGHLPLTLTRDTPFRTESGTDCVYENFHF